MSLPKNENLRNGEDLTSAGVLEESRNQEVVLKQKVKDENLYTLQNEIENNRALLGLLEKFDIDRIGREGEKNTSFLIGFILKSKDITAIKKLQEIINKNVLAGAEIKVDGLSGTETLSALKTYYDIVPTYSDSSKNEVTAVDYNNPRIIAGNLGEVASEDEAMDLALVVVTGFDTAKSQREKKQSIAAYQKSHGLSEDGVIGKGTYIEMFVGEEGQKGLLDDVMYKIDEYGISAKTQEKVIWVLTQGNHGGKNIQSLLMRLHTFRETHKNEASFEEKYSTFYATIEERKTVFINSPAGKEVLVKVEQNKESFFKYAQTHTPLETMKYIATDPTMLMIGGIMFLFGVFGSDSKFTDAWWKRLGIMVGVGLFGQDAWNKIGGSDILEAGNTAWNGARSEKYRVETSKSVREFITEKIPDATKDFLGYSEEKTKELMGKAEKINADNKDTASEKYIDPSTLETIQGTLFADRGFLGLSSEQRKEIGSKADLFLYLASDSSKTALRDINDTDIEKYIKHIYNPALGGFMSFLAYVSDTAVNTTANGVEVVGGQLIKNNEALSSSVNESLSPLIISENEKVKNVALELKNALLLGTAATFTIENYNLSPDEKILFSQLLKKLSFIFEGQKYINQNIAKVNSITPFPEGGALKDTEKTVTTYLENLYEIQNKFDEKTLNGYGIDSEAFGVNTFRKSFEEKKQELLEIADKKLHLSEIKIMVDGKEETLEIQTILKETSDKVVLEKDRSDLEAAFKNIGKIPEKTENPQKFMEFVIPNAAAFTLAQELSQKDLYKNAVIGTHEANFRNSIEAKLSLITKLTNNYTDVRKDYRDRIEVVKKSVGEIEASQIDETSYIERRLSLQKLAEKNEKIRQETISGYTLQDVSTLLMGYLSDDIQVEVSKNSFEYLNTKLGDSSITPDLESIPRAIKEKIIELEQAFNTDGKVEDVRISDRATIEKSLALLEKKKSVIDSFINTEIQARKLEEIAKQYKAIQKEYLHEMNKTNSIEEAEKIIISYRDLLKGKTEQSFWKNGWTSIESMFIEKDPVENAYAQILENSLNPSLLNQKAGSPEVIALLKSSGYLDFDEIQTLSERTKDIVNNFNRDTTTLGQILEALKTISEQASTFGQMDAEEAKKVYDVLIVSVK